jgi:hypothetical protein
MVDLQDLEQFFRVTYVVGAVIGVLIGVASGVRSVNKLRHLPAEAGSDFNERVAKRGIITGLLAAVVALLANIAMAAIYSMGPLSPLDKVGLIAHSLLAVTAPTIAMLVALVSFVVATRMMRWGGTYALFPPR